MKKTIMIIFLLLYTLSASAETYSLVEGDIGLGYTRNESNGETLLFDFDLEATKQGLGLRVKQSVDKVIIDQELDRMNVESGAQVKLYLDEKWNTYLFGDFAYEQQLQSGIDSRTMTGIGLGYRDSVKTKISDENNVDYDVWAGLYASSVYGEDWQDETPMFRACGDVDVPIGKIRVPLSLDADVDYKVECDNRHLYQVASDAGIKADLEDFFLKVGVDYLHINRPLDGARKDFHTTYVKLGVDW